MDVIEPPNYPGHKSAALWRMAGGVFSCDLLGHWSNDGNIIDVI